MVIVTTIPIVTAGKVVATLNANMAQTASDILVISTLIAETGKAVASEFAKTLGTIVMMTPPSLLVLYLDRFLLFS